MLDLLNRCKKMHAPVELDSFVKIAALCVYTCFNKSSISNLLFVQPKQTMELTQNIQEKILCIQFVGKVNLVLIRDCYILNKMV